MKKVDRKYKVCVIIMIIMVVICLTLYFLVFHTVGFNNQEAWSNFGSFFSGFLMPILTSINIFVFITLTSEIEQDRKCKKEQELQIQKEMQLMSLRFEEVKNLNNALTEVFNNNTQSCWGTPTTIDRALKCISNFHNYLGTLFPITLKRQSVFDFVLWELEEELMILSREGKDSVYALEKENLIKFKKLKYDLINALYALSSDKQENWPKETYDYLNIKQN